VSAICAALAALFAIAVLGPHLGHEFRYTTPARATINVQEGAP
jgi:hypothetical protein